jgi:hypothetical protein
MKIVITDSIDITPQAKKEIQALGATVYDDTPSSEDEIIGRIRDAEVITANYIDITPNIIDQAKILNISLCRLSALNGLIARMPHKKYQGLKLPVIQLPCSSRTRHCIALCGLAQNLRS